ncbi:MAG: hypothetical protein P8Y22_01525 [Sulfurimonas sp.]|jgi:hypothetical protein
MKYNDIKELLSVLIFSLFIFANPVVNTIAFDFDMNSASKTMLEAQEIEEAEEENEKESKSEFFLKHFALSNLFSTNTHSTYQIDAYTYRTNASLLKPPIL